MSRRARKTSLAVEQNRALETDGRDLILEDRGVTFRWHVPKAMKAARERGIALAEAASVFFDPAAIPEPDATYDDRGTYLGLSKENRILLLVHAEIVRDDELRVITSRVATPEEREKYVGSLMGKGRDPVRARRRSAFVEFFERHRRSRSVRGHAPRAGTRSRSSGLAAQMQERGWAIARALRLASQGERLREVRRVFALTQGMLADRSGIHQSAISRIERDLERLGARRAETLAKIFRVSPADLLWGLPRPS